MKSAKSRGFSIPGRYSANHNSNHNSSITFTSIATLPRGQLPPANPLLLQRPSPRRSALARTLPILVGQMGNYTIATTSLPRRQAARSSDISGRLDSCERQSGVDHNTEEKICWFGSTAASRPAMDRLRSPWRPHRICRPKVLLRIRIYNFGRHYSRGAREYILAMPCASDASQPGLCQSHALPALYGPVECNALGVNVTTRPLPQCS
jgi:hypothetical protein